MWVADWGPDANQPTSPSFACGRTTTLGAGAASVEGVLVARRGQPTQTLWQPRLQVDGLTALRRRRIDGQIHDRVDDLNIEAC